MCSKMAHSQSTNEKNDDESLDQYERPTNRSSPAWVFKNPENVSEKDLANATIKKWKAVQVVYSL